MAMLLTSASAPYCARVRSRHRFSKPTEVRPKARRRARSIELVSRQRARNSESPRSRRWSGSDHGRQSLESSFAGVRSLEELERLSGIIRGIASRGIAVLLIEHDMRFLLPLASRVVVLNFGAKIAEGTPEAVRADPAVLNAYLGEPRHA